MESETPNVESRAGQPERTTASEERSDGEQPMLFCPVCSRRLVSLRCKLLCEQCGYFMSCADYY